MIIARALITAPFIRTLHANGAQYHQRLDLHGVRLVRSCEISNIAIHWFTKPLHPDSFLQLFDPQKLSLAHSRLQNLIDEKMLLWADEIEIPVPSLEVELTNRCNASCVMCPRDQLRSLGTMTDEDFDLLLDVVSRICPPGVILQGIGEPTLDSNLEQRVMRLRGVMLAETPLVLVTNGFCLNPSRLGSLIKLGISHVQWSFHSLNKATFEYMFGVSAYTSVRRQLEDCIRLYPNFISINVVVTKKNENDVKDISEWVESLGASRKLVKPVRCISRGGEVDSGELSGIARPIESGRCLYIRKSIFIAWNGDILPCSNDIRGKDSIGNLVDIGPSDLLAKWRDLFLVPKPAFDICLKCDHHLRNSTDTEWFNLAAHAPFAKAP